MLSLFSNGDIEIAVILLIGSLFLFLYVASFFRISRQGALIIFLVHSVFSIVYVNIAVAQDLDAAFYYQQSLFPGLSFKPGTDFVIAFTKIFSVGLDLPIIAIFAIFNFIGAIGLIAFSGALKDLMEQNGPPAPILPIAAALFPSECLWSGAIGKDAWSCLAVGLFAWFLVRPYKRPVTCLSSIVVMALVRPHIALVMALALVICLMFNRHVAVSVKSGLSILSIMALPGATYFVLNYAGFDGGFSSESAADYIADRQSGTYSDTAGIDITNMNPLERLVSYAFRPLPYEAAGAGSLLASAENVILLVLVLWSLLRFRKLTRRYGALKEDRLVMIVAAAAIWTLLSFTTANLGIAVRQKWMFIPLVMMFTLPYLRASNTNRVEARELP